MPRAWDAEFLGDFERDRGEFGVVLQAVEIVRVDIAELDPPGVDQQFHLGAELPFQLVIVGIPGVEFLRSPGEKPMLVDQAGHFAIGQDGSPAIALPLPQRAQVGTQAPVGMGAT